MHATILTIVVVVWKREEVVVLKVEDYVGGCCHWLQLDVGWLAPGVGRAKNRLLVRFFTSITTSPLISAYGQSI